MLDASKTDVPSYAVPFAVSDSICHAYRFTDNGVHIIRKFYHHCARNTPTSPSPESASAGKIHSTSNCRSLHKVLPDQTIVPLPGSSRLLFSHSLKIHILLPEYHKLPLKSHLPYPMHNKDNICRPVLLSHPGHKAVSFPHRKGGFILRHLFVIWRSIDRILCFL